MGVLVVELGKVLGDSRGMEVRKMVEQPSKAWIL